MMFDYTQLTNKWLPECFWEPFKENIDRPVLFYYLENDKPSIEIQNSKKMDKDFMFFFILELPNGCVQVEKKEDDTV